MDHRKLPPGSWQTGGENLIVSRKVWLQLHREQPETETADEQKPHLCGSYREAGVKRTDLSLSEQIKSPI